MGFLPYIRIPTRYIFDPNQTVNIKVAINIPTESASCHHGTPNGIRINITIGDVNGIIEKIVAIEPSGFSITAKKPT